MSVRPDPGAVVAAYQRAGSARLAAAALGCSHQHVLDVARREGAIVHPPHVVRHRRQNEGGAVAATSPACAPAPSAPPSPQTPVLGGASPLAPPPLAGVAA